MKLLNLLLMIVAMEFALLIFLNVTTPVTSLTALTRNPESWSNLALISQLQLIIAGLGAAVIIVGLFVGAKSDFLIMAPLVTVLLSYGVTFAYVYQNLTSQAQFHPNNYIVMLVLTPIIIAYFYTIIKFWRGND